MADTAPPTSTADDSTSPATDDDAGEPSPESPSGTPGGDAAPAGPQPSKKRVVKKIVKKVPVATRAVPGRAPTDGDRAAGAGSTPATASTRATVPLAKDVDRSQLPPPPAAAMATAAARRPPPPVASTTTEDVRRVGPLQRRRLGRLRARKVRRILRHVEVWSVLKVSIVFYFCLWLVLLVSGAMVWKVATQAGLIDNVENFLQESGFDEVEFDGETMFRAWATGGFVMVFASTGFTVLMALLFNLISDLMGGVRFTVIELETIRRRKSGGRRTSPSGPGTRPGQGDRGRPRP